MATVINSADPTYSLVVEVTEGTTPTTGTRYELPVAADQAPPVYSSAEVPSNVKRPKRESGGTQRGMGSIDWSVETDLFVCPVFDKLFESALSGTFTANKLIAGDADKSVSVISALKANTAVDPDPDNGMFYIDAGLQVNSLGISVAGGDSPASVSFGFMGLSRVESTEGYVTSITAAPTVLPFTLADLKNVTLTTGDGDVVLGVSSLEFNSGQTKELRPVSGQKDAIGVGTSGSRETTVALRVYRESFAINSDVTGAPQKLSFEFERGGEGYRFTLPGAIGQVVTDELSGSSLLAALNFSAAYDNTSASGLFIEKL